MNTPLGILSLFMLFNAFFSLQLQAYGLAAGTLVKLSTDYKPIEELQWSDKVSCYNFKKGFANKSIAGLTKRSMNAYIQLYVDDQCISVGHTYLFYSAEKRKWIKAQDITPQHVFYKHGYEPFSFDTIIEVIGEVDLYNLTVERFHNFCITEYDIPVHN